MAPQASNKAQPYVVQLGDGEATVNTALADKPEYAFLFKAWSREEQAYVQRQMPLWWGMTWLSIIGCYCGLWHPAIMAVFNILCFARMGYGAHDVMHLPNSFPKLYRLCMPFPGFTPFCCSYVDLAWGHMMDHHKSTKAVLDHTQNDWDARWSERHLLHTIAMLCVWPASFSVFEVLGHWLKHPKTFWPERIALQLFYWFELFVVYKMGLLWPVLTAGHIGSVALFLLFHGLTHRDSFYRVLLKDISGLRHVPYVDALMNILVPPSGWIEMKFHDVHHAFPHSIGTISSRVYALRDAGMYQQWQRVENAAANMVDEGLFLDKKGNPVTHLASAGHEIGVRQRYLAAMASLEKSDEAKLGGRKLSGIIQKTDSITHTPSPCGEDEGKLRRRLSSDLAPMLG